MGYLGDLGYIFRLYLLGEQRGRNRLTCRAALDFVLGGIMLAQLVTYCSSSKRDKPFNRIVVVSFQYERELNVGDQLLFSMRDVHLVRLDWGSS